MLGLKKKSSVVDRVTDGDLSGSVQALRGHAHHAIDRVAPSVDAAQKAIAPKVEQAKDALAPSVEAAQKAVAPKVESAWAAMAPALSSLAASAVDAARNTAVSAEKKSEPSRKEARARAKNTAAALRGERRRRWPLVVGAFALGSALGAAAGAISRRLRSPLPSATGSFTDLTPRHADSANGVGYTSPTPSAVPDPAAPTATDEDGQPTPRPEDGTGSSD